MVDEMNRKEATEAIKIALKPIQAGINARISRVHGLSPNQLMFGKALNELSDIKLCVKHLNDLENKNKWNETELKYLKRLELHLKIFDDIARQNRDKYIKVMKDYYDKHWKKRDIAYKIGQAVMYYIGDKDQNSRKLRQKWSGPWKVAKKLQENAYELTDGGKRTWPAHVERRKLYYAREYWSLKKYNKMIENGEINDELNNSDDTNNIQIDTS